MKAKELKSRPLKELLELQRRVSAAIKTKQAQMKAARQRIVALAAQIGVTTRELASLIGKRGPDKAPRKTRTAKVKGVRGTAAFQRKANGSAESRVTH